MSNPTLTHLEYCTYCPKMCRHACPVSTASGVETHTPQAKMSGLATIRKGHARWDREATDALWACTGCRACTTECVHGVEVGATLFAGRVEAVRRGAVPSALDRYPERFRAREERLAKQARARLPKDRFSDEAQVGLWPGCDAVDKGEADVLAELALLDRVGAEHVKLVAAERMCGGYPLLAAGQLEAFRWHGMRVADELRRYRTVVMTCSACVFALRTLYPAEGITMATEVLHVTEYLAAFAPRLKPTGDGGPVHYHDPCHLSRHLALTEPPRTLLGRVAEVREFSWSHDQTECCGGGGLLPKTMPTVADDMARRRLREVPDGGTVVTSCGTCKHMLARNAPRGVVVRDLVELLEERTRPA